MSATIPLTPVSTASQSSLTSQELQERPWKFTGYRRFSQFLASDTDFLVIRRFDILNARVLLWLQDQLCVLENLERLDKQYSRREAEDVNNGTMRDELPDRADMVESIYKKLKEYNEFVQGCSNLRARPQPPEKDVASIRKWFEEHEKTINDGEQMYIAREDLISLVNQMSTPLRRFLERYVIFRTWYIWLWKKEPPSNLPTHEHEKIQYVSERRLNHIVSATVTTVGLAMLIVPLWVLEIVHESYCKLGIISGFIVLFLGMTSYATAARPFETLAATAGYAAVMVVFLQLGTSSTAT